jgi:hypothetical protein
MDGHGDDQAPPSSFIPPLVSGGSTGVFLRRSERRPIRLLPPTTVLCAAYASRMMGSLDLNVDAEGYPQIQSYQHLLNASAYPNVHGLQPLRIRPAYDVGHFVPPRAALGEGGPAGARRGASRGRGGTRCSRSRAAAAAEDTNSMAGDEEDGVSYSPLLYSYVSALLIFIYCPFSSTACTYVLLYIIFATIYCSFRIDLVHVLL